MALYGFKCNKHGEFEVWQSMKAVHIAVCPKCKKTAIRVYTPSLLNGDLPYKNSQFSLGHTREELYKNLGKEGLEQKETYKFDKHQREEDLIRKQKSKADPIKVYAT